MSEAARVPTLSETSVVEYDVTDAQIAELAAKYDTVPEDLSDKDNYAFVQSAIRAIKPIRTGVEKKRKELKADALAWGRKVDSKAKDIKDKLLAIEEPFADAKKAYDTKVELEKREKAKREEERIDRIAERIAGIKALVSVHVSSTAEQIEKEIKQLGKDASTVDEWAMEFSLKAEEAIREAESGLEELFALKTQQEKLAAEQEEQRKAEEARKKEEERKAKEEQAKREKELQKERDRLLAEQREEKRKDGIRNKIAEFKGLVADSISKSAKEIQEVIDDLKEEFDAADKWAMEFADKARSEIDYTQLKLNELKHSKVEQEEKSRLEKEAETERIKAEQQAKEAEEAKQVQQETAPTNQNGYSDDWRNAANSIKAIIGDKAKSKQLMDAITSGNIPNITYTGE